MTLASARLVEYDAAAERRHLALRDEFLIDPDVVFLNHGSYGACPRPVFERYQAWQRELEREPVDFIGRRLPELLAAARAELAVFVGARPDDLTFVPNATTGVNMAARALDLREGDEVLASDLEYGGCDLAWERLCSQTGARYVRAPIDRLFESLTERTRAVFVSHITSETALLLPVAEIVARARAEGLTTIVDGAHAVAQVDLDLDALGADFYAGNCHKWLCAPKGAGFVHVRPEWQERVDGPITSWGHAEPATFISRTERQGTPDSTPSTLSSTRRPIPATQSVITSFGRRVSRSCCNATLTQRIRSPASAAKPITITGAR